MLINQSKGIILKKM